MTTPAAEKLALHGGPPVIPAGPPCWPLADEAVRAALEAAYADGSWGRYHGPHVERLETTLKTLHQVAHSICCSSGTVAVELSLRGLKVTTGDEVILAAYDFAGNFRCIETVGATPVLIDIDPKTWCLDVDQLEAALSPRVKAVIVSHLHGGLARMPDICQWAADHGVAIVEDACQAPGAIVCGKPAGSWGDVGVLSFGGSKLLTAGRGGAVLSQRADVHQRIKIYGERGNQAYPLSELQAAVLAPQLEKLAERNRCRRENVARLLEHCRDVDGLRPLQLSLELGEASFYKVPWLYEPQQVAGHPRDEFIAAMRAEGVALDAGFRGFTQRTKRRCRAVGTLAHSRLAGEATVLLHHPVLLEPPPVMAQIAAAMRKVLRHFRQA
ncbi:MAG: aminotransferase class I/II-fold pyridoxal phosphate-dependent enzyme [Planctomycetota bacterium]|nr:aminotransferase class I/II-fold pyridoxal phosphate-dependent enzyme [Planctomycetota bacterium]